MLFRLRTFWLWYMTQGVVPMFNVPTQNNKQFSSAFGDGFQ